MSAFDPIKDAEDWLDYHDEAQRLSCRYQRRMQDIDDVARFYRYGVGVAELERTLARSA